MDFKLNHREILIAEHNDQAAGYLRLEYIWTKVPYIGLILVKEEYRGQGVGTALIQFPFPMKRMSYQWLRNGQPIPIWTPGS
ncbi:GNAT family N-acetyltransferase [Paenibacillus sinensis]|uniref:GNAT family N-acetyltransferase n=1 Tax=Paenibacillus sinensis TaxID=2834413 RepID=UPI00389950BE